MSILTDVATQAQSYRQAYENGSLSPQDYKELINDLNIAQHIESTASDFAEDQEARAILLGALQIAESLY
jgi:hypothetical protein